MHRMPYSTWQGVMVPHVNLMICGGWVSAPLNKGCPASLLTNEAASRPCSIDAAVWLAFVAVNGSGFLVCYGR